MRLTLRTLLAYLDDTLDPAEAKQIGQKVAESEVARETIDRIKRVIRKRSLGIPPQTGPEKADPNAVAEYLDSDLPEGKVNEIEDQALKSDVHLAEIAACHQLLTLILSEPVTVPPTSRQRMYNLVKGPESDPTRRVQRVIPATIAAETIEPEEWDGHPLVSRRGGRKRLALAAGLALLLGLTIWRTMTPPDQSASINKVTDQVAQRDATPKANEVKEGDTTDKPAPAAADAANDKAAKDMPVAKVPAPDANKNKVAAPAPEVGADKSRAVPANPPPVEPTPPADPRIAALAAARRVSDDRSELGKLTTTGGVLLQKVTPVAKWQTVALNAPVTGSAWLMAIPGTSSEVRLADAVGITLWGATPEYSIPLLESEVQIFTPPSGFTADLRLEAGRIYLRATKPAGAKVRLRIASDILDITFPDEKAEAIAEIIHDVFGQSYVKDAKSRPARRARGFLGVTRGQLAVRANLKPEVTLEAAPAAVLPWSSETGIAEKPMTLPNAVATWAKVPSLTGADRDAYMEMNAVAKRIPQLFGPGREVDLAVSEIARDQNPNAGIRLCLYSQAAIDQLPPLLEEVENEVSPFVRLTANMAVVHWLSRSTDRDDQLVEALIAQRKYAPDQAELAVTLWHGFSDAAINDPKTYTLLLNALESDKLGIRDNAANALRQLDGENNNIRFVPTDREENRRQAVQAWRKRIPEGAVPAQLKPRSEDARGKANGKSP